ncbi:unnamed protein product [Rhizoctonia solani]|uniref:Laminin domain protein n=1 Tax=Rhizoctonia solani TaxID=456999 RepID=A0A8H3D0L9_9AGAM|nr:unnamed protein product [Rhizoctonia solani]
MTNYPPGQIYSPPELPSYLKNICDLKEIVGVPNDEEMFGIHAVIRMAQRFVDIPDICTPELLSRLSEHLFSAQMARYRSQYPCSIFRTDTIYTPPVLPAHVSSNLEPVSGTPSSEQIAKVQEAVRLYQRLAEIPTMFDPQVNADLSQHFFNIQMEAYLRHNSTVTCPGPVPGEPRIAKPASRTPGLLDGLFSKKDHHANVASNNAGTGADSIQSHEHSQIAEDADIRDAVERSNRLAEQANQLAERSNLLIERSNEIAERANQLVERSSQPSKQPNPFAERFAELYEQLNKHFEASNQHHQRSNSLAKEFMEPVLKFGDVLKNINKVLVGIQHAIVRVYKGNTTHAVDCLVNERGETPSSSKKTELKSFAWISSRYKTALPVVVGGTSLDLFVPDGWLATLLSFYGIWEGMCEKETSPRVKEGKEKEARERLSRYLSSCLG